MAPCSSPSASVHRNSFQQLRGSGLSSKSPLVHQNYFHDAGEAIRSGHVEFPGDAVRVFEGDIAFAQSFIEFGPGVLDARFRKGGGHPIDFPLYLASQRDVIQADSEGTEHVIPPRLGVWPTHSDGRRAAEEY